jgi:hypothetical protein
MPWIGSAIQAGGSILGGMMGSNAAGDAARALQDSQTYNAGVALNNRVETEARMAPYLATGTAANRRLAALLGLGGTPGGSGMLNEGDGVNNPVYKRIMAAGGYSSWDQVPPEQRRAAYAEVQQTNALAGNDSNAADYGSLTRNFSANDLNADPVYQSGLQFGLDEGRRGLNERAIANGGYDSGATLKALTRFGNDYGSTKADQSFNRFQQQNSNVYNRLTGQQGVGLNAAGAVTGAGNLATGQMMDASSSGANAAAAGRVGQANAMAGAFGGIGTAIQGYQNNQILNKILADRNRGTGMGGTIYGAGGSFNPDN